MSLVVPSTSNSGGYGKHSWTLMGALAWLNKELTKQKSDVSVKEVALELIEDYPALADLVIVYEVGGFLYKYRIPEEQSKLTKTLEFDNIMKTVLRDINDNVTVFLPVIRTLKSIRRNRKCSIVFDWDESGIDVTVRVHLNKKRSVEKKFKYDRQAFVYAYKQNRLEHALFKQIVLFIGDGARVAFEEAKPPMCRKSLGPPRGAKRDRIHHGKINIPKKKAKKVEI